MAKRTKPIEASKHNTMKTKWKVATNRNKQQHHEATNKSKQAQHNENGGENEMKGHNQ